MRWSKFCFGFCQGFSPPSVLHQPAHKSRALVKDKKSFRFLIINKPWLCQKHGILGLGRVRRRGQGEKYNR